MTKSESRSMMSLQDIDLNFKRTNRTTSPPPPKSTTPSTSQMPFNSQLLFTPLPNKSQNTHLSESSTLTLIVLLVLSTTTSD